MSIHFLFKSVLLLLLLLTTGAHAQDSLQVAKHPPAKKPVSKKLITKLEVFAGPGLAFNRGNMFVENYRDANVTNKRLLKPAYLAGVGVYAPLTKRIDLNVRMQYEQKGTSNLLNLPLIEDVEGSREIHYDDITYHYLTIVVAPQFHLDKRRRFSVSTGLYSSRIIGLESCLDITNTFDDFHVQGCWEGRNFLGLDNEGYTRSITSAPNLGGLTKYVGGLATQDYGISLALAYNLPLSKKHTVSFQVWNNLGLRNINRTKPYGLRERNNTLNLSIAYLYYLSSKK